MISVCIATYNGEKYIKEQVQSILTQLNDDDEVIISDDNSNDSTIKIVKNLNDSRIKIITNKYEKGYTKNFQNAIENAKGDYIFLSDQDDIWKENKKDTMLFYLKKGYDFVVSDAEIVNEKLELIYHSFYKFRNSKPGFYMNILRFSYIGCCMAFTKNVKKLILPFPNNQKYCTHDNWIYIISSYFFKIYHINEQLILYRRHENNTSLGGKKSSNNIIFKTIYRIYIIYHLFIRIMRHKNEY